MAEPLTLVETTVKPEWIDEFDHMNVANYVLVCDLATYAFWRHVNGGLELEARGGLEYAVLESHVHYLGELRLGDPLRITTQLLESDDKRFRIFHQLYHAQENFLSATNEIKSIGFDLKQRRVTRFSGDVLKRLSVLQEEHGRLPLPAQAGHGISLAKR